MLIKHMSIKSWVYILSLLVGLSLTTSCHDPYLDKIILKRKPAKYILSSDPVAKIYHEKIKHLDTLGPWIDRAGCDSLLWNGLACAAGVSINIDLAEYNPGELHRRPKPACWDKADRGAKSTISNDMVIGWTHCKAARKDYKSITRFYETARKNLWVIGKPLTVLSRVVLKVNMVATIREILKLRNPGFPVFFPVSKDYERHIGALLIELNGAARNGLTENMVDILESYIKQDPKDPLPYAVLGNKSKARELFLAGYIPSYVRGSKEYKHIYRAFVAGLILK